MGKIVFGHLKCKSKFVWVLILLLLTIILISRIKTKDYTHFSRLAFFKIHKM